MCKAKSFEATSEEEVVAFVSENERVRVSGGGSKPALTRVPDGFVSLNVARLSGILRYDPDEFTISAWAGTPIAEVIQLLEEKGQYFPFDPPLASSGATLGGVVAAATNGPGRYRYGGVRDFLIGVHFVDGAGRLIEGGGAVVKNAAGFDFPKLMVGSLGRLAVLTRVIFKVFPRAQKYGTLEIGPIPRTTAFSIHTKIVRSHYDVWALDLVPDNEQAVIRVRLSGPESSLSERLQGLQSDVGGQILDEGEEPEYWREMTSMDWISPSSALIKIPITPGRMRDLEEKLTSSNAERRYSVGGNLLWLGWPESRQKLETLLREEELSGLLLRGDFEGSPWLGRRANNAFLQAIAQSLDATQKFGLDLEVQGS